MANKPALLIVAALAVLVVIGSQAVAGSQARPANHPTYTPPPTPAWVPPMPEGETTDVLVVALRIAYNYGLTKAPDDMYIAEGTYSQFKEPGSTSVLASDSQLVWVVWIKANFTLRSRSDAFDTKNLFLYFNADTGQSLDLYASDTPVISPHLDLSQHAWTRVTRSDIGNYPIPVFTPPQIPNGQPDGLAPTHIPVLTPIVVQGPPTQR